LTSANDAVAESIAIDSEKQMRRLTFMTASLFDGNLSHLDGSFDLYQ
jgi:hypothetical protein